MNHSITNCHTTNCYLPQYAAHFMTVMIMMMMVPMNALTFTWFQWFPSEGHQEWRAPWLGGRESGGGSLDTTTPLGRHKASHSVPWDSCSPMCKNNNIDMTLNQLSGKVPQCYKYILTLLPMLLMIIYTALYTKLPFLLVMPILPCLSNREK